MSNDVTGGAGLIRSSVAYATLALSFVVTLLLTAVSSVVPRWRWSPTGRILVTGRFDSRNWFLSHAVPLSRSGVEEVIFVSEAPVAALDRVRFFCPPPWVCKVLGRALAKLVWMAIAGLRFRPDVYMGYHIFPGAMTALIVGRVFGRPTCYQMTGGPIEIAGGGVDNENALMSSLGRPSAFLERLATAVVRRFDLVVVRGDRAKRFLENRGVAGSVVIITGSIDPPRAADGSDRRFDLIFVGRLTRIKQPEQFVEIVSLVARRLPEVRAVVVGVGPELEMLRLRALELGVSGNIDFLGKRDDVWRLLNRAKVFVLTSRSEGMSIAMAEAMSCGVPAVVADVGELGDLISNGVNGWLVPANDIATYAGHIVDLLTDDRKWVGCSQAAIDSALSLMGVDNVARRWGDCLGRLVSDRRTPTGSCAW